MCGVHGALILSPVGFGEVNSFGRGAMVSLEVAGTVRVRRDTGESGSGGCVDAGEGLPGLQLELARRGGRLVATTPPGPSSGRCAGPLASDLARVSLPARRNRAARPTFDLRGTRAFSAGPFSGTLTSTLLLAPAATNGQSVTGSSGSSSGPGHSHRHLVEHVELRYRLDSVPSALDIGFSGAADSSCAILDTCGATGSLRLSSITAHETIEMSALRDVRRRVSSRRALEDFRAGRLRLTLPGFAQVNADVSESFAWPGAAACRDSAGTPALSLIIGSFPGPRPAARLPVTLENQTSEQVLRTRCPGPADQDMIAQGNSEVIARTSVTASELLAPRTALSLSSPGDFSGLGYTGTRRGALTLELTRTAVQAGTTTAG